MKSGPPVRAAVFPRDDRRPGRQTLRDDNLFNPDVPVLSVFV
jgi:hypothetical protein